jgi:transmembrane sensor
MTKMNNNKQKLILKFIENTLSSDEKLELEKLKQSDKDFASEFEEILEIQLQTKRIPLPHFEYKPFEHRKGTYHLINNKWLKIAAVLLIGLFLGITATNILTHKKNQYLRVATERGDKIRVDLPDGITIWLNSRSEISYNASFDGANRVVELKGEAFVSLEENTTPFIVKSYDTEIICTNGSFNIENDTSLQTTEIEVKSGWIALRNPETYNKQFVIEEGFKGIVNKYMPLWIEQNSNPNYLAWHTNKLSFVKTTLQDVAETLMDVYDVEILIPDDTKYCTISNTYINQGLNSILNKLKSEFNIQIEKNDHSIIITGNPC